MVITKDRVDKINAVGGLRIDAKDAIFIIKRCKSVQWGENVSYSSPGAIWYEYDALIVITHFHVLKLSWFEMRQGKAANDKIVETIRSGKIKSLIDLYSEISQYINIYRSPITLVETKLERYL